MQRENKKNSNKDMQELWDKIKKYKIYIIEIAKEQEKEQSKTIFEITMTENFSKLMTLHHRYRKPTKYQAG